MRVHHSSNEPARSGTASSSTRDVREPGAGEQAARAGRRRRARTGRARRAAAPARRAAALTASNTSPSHGLRSRGPQTATATRPPGRSTRRDLARRARRVDGEHQPLAAEHDVVGRRRARRSPRGRARACATFVEPERRGARRRRSRSSPAATSESDDLAAGRDARRGREADAARRRRPARAPARPAAARSASSIALGDAPRRARRRSRRARAQPPATRRPTWRGAWARSVLVARSLGVLHSDPPRDSLLVDV